VAHAIKGMDKGEKQTTLVKLSNTYERKKEGEIVFSVRIEERDVSTARNGRRGNKKKKKKGMSVKRLTDGE